MTDHTLGDAPIEREYGDKMRALAQAIDGFFNRELKGKDRKVGFIVMVFPFDNHEGRCNYISNAERSDVVTMLKEQLARFEGQPEMKGEA